jgi:subfamily B ATP-binding cassette protein MsbA
MSKSSRNKEKTPHIANAKILYLRLFHYAWQHKVFFGISIISIFILSASNTAFLALIKQVTDEGFVDKSPDKVMLLPFMLFGLMALRGFASFASTYGVMWHVMWWRLCDKKRLRV